MKNKKRYKGLSERIVSQLAKSEEYKIEGEHEKALQIARKILMKDPSCIPAAEEVLDNLVSLQEFEESEKIASFILAREKDSYIAHYALGFILLTSGDNAAALPYLQKANLLNDNNPEILRCLGWAIFNVESKLKGLVTLERALNLRPDDPLILCDLGVCLLHEHVFEKAIYLFEQALALEPENERAKDCLNAAIELEEQFEVINANPQNKGELPSKLGEFGDFEASSQTKENKA